MHKDWAISSKMYGRKEMKVLMVYRKTAEYPVLMKHLSSQGFIVDSLIGFHEASKVVDDGYNCFIIGIDRLSSKQGIEFLKSVRYYYPKIPVLALYCDEKVEVSIVKNLYLLGCDDVIKKPFILEEIDAKIARLLHIRKDVIRFGKEGSFDFGLGVLRMGSMQQHFSTKEKRLLAVLFSHKESLVSFETIKACVWDGEEVNLESIRSLVRRVRQKIPFECIKTVVNSGYILKLEKIKDRGIVKKRVNPANETLFYATKVPQKSFCTLARA
jgi:two-component system OmpR family response regulator